MTKKLSDFQTQSKDISYLTCPSSIGKRNSHCSIPNQERRLSECGLAWVGGIFIHLQPSLFTGRDPVFLQHQLFFNLLCPDSYNSACPL